MNQLKRIAGFLLLLSLAIVLSACGSSLQKPTGLEIEEQSEMKTDNHVGQGPLDEVVEEEKQLTEKESGELKNPVGKTETSSVKEETASVPSTEKKPANVEKPTVDPTTKKQTTPVDKPTATAKEKQSEKTTERPTANPTSKPIETLPEKTAEKSIGKKQEKQSEQQAKPDSKPIVEESAASTVVYSIMISSSEIPLPPTEMEIENGDTVLSTLITITKKHKVQMDYRGGRGATAYVEGIANVYEFDRGQGSGWMYRVNGVFPDRGAGAVPLQDGDRIEWLYTTDLGVDLNADLKPFRR